MQNWQKERNYRKYKNADGTFTYVITVDGEDVEVSKAVYSVYAQSERQLEYIESDLKRNRALRGVGGKLITDANGIPIVAPEREISLDKLMGEDWDYPTDEPQPEETVLHAMEIEALRRYLGLLNKKEQTLIRALFFEGMTEQEYAEMLGVRQQSVNERKRRILRKIKKLLEQPC